MTCRALVRVGLGVGLLATALLPVSQAGAEATTPTCGTGEIRSIAQAQTTGFQQVFKVFQNERPNGGLGESVESCTFRLFLDGAVFEFAADEPVWAGWSYFQPHEDFRHDEFLAELSLLSEVTSITDVATGSTWQVQLQGSAVRSARHATFGPVWVQERGVELLLPAGEYEVRTVFSHDSVAILDATVTVIVASAR